MWRNIGVEVRKDRACADSASERYRVGRRLVAQWLAVHGPFTVHEIIAARAEMAEADAEAVRRSRQAP
jgi:hypothetical protein